jgi:hypothetical protein
MKLFEDVKASPKFSTDVNVINELINIYEVLDMKDKFKMLLAEYEAIESIVPDEQKAAVLYQPDKDLRQKPGI